MLVFRPFYFTFLLFLKYAFIYFDYDNFGKKMLKLHISNVVELLKMEGTLQFSVNCQSFVYLAYWFKVNYYLKT